MKEKEFRMIENEGGGNKDEWEATIAIKKKSKKNEKKNW